jgi:hypothetical protein
LDLSSSLKLVHGDFHNVIAVVEDQQLRGNVDEIRVESVHLSVVVDLEALDAGDFETAQIADEGIGNSNVLNLSNTCGTETELSETGKLDEAESAKALEGGKAEGVEALEVFELELATNGGDSVTGDAQKLTGTLGLEVSLDLLGAVDKNATLDALVNNDIGINDIAVDDRCGLGDLDVLCAS